MPHHLSFLKSEMDSLWQSHYWYTRQVIRDAVSNSPCLNVDLDALYENQDDLGANFAKLTDNKKAGTKLTAALKEHITIAVNIVLAAIKGEDIKKLYAQWQVNASEIAEIYHHYNHCIKFKTMNKHMQEHLDTTLAEAVAIIEGNCAESYETGEVALAHVRVMAAYIASKFPCNETSDSLDHHCNKCK